MGDHQIKAFGPQFVQLLLSVGVLIHLDRVATQLVLQYQINVRNTDFPLLKTAPIPVARLSLRQEHQNPQIDQQVACCFAIGGIIGNW